MRPILITGGAPRVAVDAIRFLTVQATGSTAVALRTRLAARGSAVTLLLSELASPGVDAERYGTRDDLEARMRAWITANPQGVVVMSAAVNDYQVAEVTSHGAAGTRVHPPGTKVPSGANEVLIRLVPAGKIVDSLHAWGLRGPLVAFKYEASDTVIASARALGNRLGAAVMVANSLDGSVQALVDPLRVTPCADRNALLDALSDRLVELAQR